MSVHRLIAVYLMVFILCVTIDIPVIIFFFGLRNQGRDRTWIRLFLTLKEHLRERLKRIWVYSIPFIVVCAICLQEV